MEIYEIQKIEDIVDIPEEYIDDFVEELREYLKKIKKHNLTKKELHDMKLDYTPDNKKEYVIADENGEQLEL
jgi:Na+/phosphate symporter